MSKIRLSCDDGCASDVRVANLCNKYGLECIFYWPVEWHSLAYENGYQPLDYSDAIEIAELFEVGSHTVTHRHLTKIPFEDACCEIYESQQILEDMFGLTVRKFAPPRGYTNKELTDFTNDIYEEQRLTKGEHLVHVHPDSGANGNKPWRECITKKTTELWFHSWELDRFNLWDELEEWMREYTST